MRKLDRIPTELKELPQWVCVNNGSKIPMQADRNKAASSSNPETWCDFQIAEKAVKSGYYDHVGFVFNGNGIVGIDIDCGFQGAVLTELSLDIMDACRSYTEKSRSGRGIHILVKGTLPFKGKNNNNGVEIYQTGRYFITTGDKLVFGELVENQPGIDYVLEKYFPEAVKNSQSLESSRLYTPEYRSPENGKINLRPHYPKIGQGGRNMCLASLAGQLHNLGYTREAILKELLFANEQACNPPLPESEVKGIVASITRYQR